MSKPSPRNRVRCLRCGTVLESKSVHDFKSCGCSNKTSVDGGLDYQKIGGVKFSLINIINDDDTETGMSELMKTDDENVTLRARVEEELERRRAEQDNTSVLMEENRKLRAEYDRLCAKVKAWKSTIEGLTPGGSEYVDDPTACAAYIRERCKYPRQILDLRTQLAAMEDVERLSREFLHGEEGRRYTYEVEQELDAALADLDEARKGDGNG